MESEGVPSGTGDRELPSDSGPDETGFFIGPEWGAVDRAFPEDDGHSDFPGLGWSTTSPQQAGRDSEAKTLKALGARQHPNSGAGRIKYDGSTDTAIVELKEAARSYQLRSSYVEDLFRHAARQGKDATLVVRFPDYMVTCRIERA